MENATDALKMAAAVLIFVLALSISINAFGEARRASQVILDYRDREYDYTYITSGTTQRQVGLETIIPSIYKAYKENYKIIFDMQNINDKNGLYSKKNENGNYDEINYIDLEKEVLGSDKQKEEFIKAIIYGKDSISDEYKKEFSDLGINLKDVGIYARIKGNKVTEKLGVYYQEDMQTGGSNTPDANKTKKRVITYTDK
mgnify:FL=1